MDSGDGQKQQRAGAEQLQAVADQDDLAAIEAVGYMASRNKSPGRKSANPV
jgi:hypothetical protein